VVTKTLHLAIKHLVIILATNFGFANVYWEKRHCTVVLVCKYTARKVIQLTYDHKTGHIDYST